MLGLLFFTILNKFLVLDCYIGQMGTLGLKVFPILIGRALPRIEDRLRDIVSFYEAIWLHEKVRNK